MKSLIGFVAIAFCTMLLTALTPAHAITSFGRTSIGATVSGGLRADFKRGSKFVLPEHAVMLRICAYIDGKGGGSGSQNLRFALYRDRNGVPAEQVLESENRGVEALAQADWSCRETARAPIESGTYWLIIHTAGDPGVIRYFYDGAANWFGNADIFADGASDTFGNGGAGEGTISIRAEYLTESEIRFAGTRTVGTRTSSPMSANMKRGSSFVLNEGAVLGGISAYVDGLGGTVGSQPLAIGLYEDVNGEPSTLVGWGPVPSWNIGAGRTARWVSAFAAINGRNFLQPGKYWIILHTRGPAGVLRYYLEGMGNWRGNADSGTQPSPIFGVANAGDGTITAHIIYTPANITSDTFGRTTPGNIPSGAMTANFIRGSQFHPDKFFGGEPTALWAYLDGNGGANGSQKVRLALYESQSPGSPLNRMSASDEVTVSAGMAARWVRFSLPYSFFSNTPADQSKNYYVMLLSGGTQGVARYYLSNDADNWLGGPNDYSAGPPASIAPGALATGTRTMSVYVEYMNTDEFPRP